MLRSADTCHTPLYASVVGHSFSTSHTILRLHVARHWHDKLDNKDGVGQCLCPRCASLPKEEALTCMSCSTVQRNGAFQRRCNVCMSCIQSRESVTQPVHGPWHRHALWQELLCSARHRPTPCRRCQAHGIVKHILLSVKPSCRSSLRWLAIQYPACCIL